MRVLIISDIHANMAALDAVLAQVPLSPSGQVDAVWCLGDIVGYGPNPNECVARVKSLPNLVCLMGNHDKAVLDETSIEVFNADARAALYWTRSVATTETLAFLRALPEVAQVGAFTLVHGSPRQPIWEYILDRGVAQEVLTTLQTPYCLVGHTHVPVIYGVSNSDSACFVEAPDYVRPRKLQAKVHDEHLILNPGSVGQPRDNNANAAYALLDTEAGDWEYCRVFYNVELTQNRMRNVGLPSRLVSRLAYGW
jgi:predicted phosphodiesterase